MKQILSFLYFSLLFFSFCDKLFDSGDSKPGYLDYFPKKTQVGANTFGCYINGELAASQGYFQEEGIRSSMLGPYGYANGYWGIYPDTIMRFDIRLKQVSIIMRYVYLHKGIYDCEVNIRFRDNQDLFGSAVTTVNITKLDRLNHIISGEFGALEIPLYKTDSIVYLNKVRFDIKYGSDF